MNRDDNRDNADESPRPAAARENMERYLDALLHALRHAPAAERVEIAYNAKEQLEAAHATGGNTGLAKALAAMPPPEKYAEDYPPPAGGGAAGHATGDGTPRGVHIGVNIGWDNSQAGTAGWKKQTGAGHVLKAFFWLAVLAASLVLMASGAAWTAMAILWGVALVAVGFGQLVTRRAGWSTAVFLIAFAGSAGAWIWLYNSRPDSPALPVVASSTQPATAAAVSDPWDGFVDDPAVVGVWKAVDFTDSPRTYAPALGREWQGNLMWSGLTFDAAGVVEWRFTRGGAMRTLWTCGKILPRPEEFSEQPSEPPAYYELRTINGVEYLFVEHISGDVTIRGMKPKWYVYAREPDE